MNSEKLNFKSISVLIVDDDSEILDMMKIIVSRIVGTVYTASNGKDGLESYKTNKPDMVISDIRMPLLTGLEMAKEIKEISPEQPIAIISAHNDTELFLDSIDIGIDKYFLKPLKANLLIEWIQYISKQIITRKNLKLQEENLHFIMNHNPDGICMIDGDKISYLNNSFLKLMHLDSFEIFDPDKHCIVNFIVNEDGSQRFKNLDELKLFLNNYEEEDNIVRILVPNNSNDTINFYNLFFKIYPEIQRIIMIFTNITNIQQERNLFKIQATTDALTQIPNRMYFDLYLERQIASAQREGTVFSLLMFDIDDFKVVNDTYGHPTGDKVLIELIQVVKSHIRKNDFIARWGGEEFMILSRSNTKEGEILAEKLLYEIRNHKFEIVGKVTCSFGISSFEVNSTAKTLIKNVDKALYEAKGDGKDCVKIC